MVAQGPQWVSEVWMVCLSSLPVPQHWAFAHLHLAFCAVIQIGKFIEYQTDIELSHKRVYGTTVQTHAIIWQSLSVTQSNRIPSFMRVDTNAAVI